MKRLIAAVLLSLLAVPAIASDIGSEPKESVFAQDHNFVSPPQ